MNKKSNSDSSDDFTGLVIDLLEQILISFSLLRNQNYSLVLVEVALWLHLNAIRGNNNGV